MFSHACFGVTIHEARSGGPNEYVIETEDRLEKWRVDKIVELFAID